MKRVTLLLVPVLALLLAGCEPSGPVEEQLRVKLEKLLELKDVKVREAGPSAFTGWGMSKNGLSWEIKLTQDSSFKKEFDFKAWRGNAVKWGTVYVR